MNTLFKNLLCGAGAAADDGRQHRRHVLHDGTMFQQSHGHAGQGTVPHPRSDPHTDLLGTGICGPGREEADGIFWQTTVIRRHRLCIQKLSATSWRPWMVVC